jgi:hypothetical protein
MALILEMPPEASTCREFSGNLRIWKMGGEVEAEYLP